MKLNLNLCMLRHLRKMLMQKGFIQDIRCRSQVFLQVRRAHKKSRQDYQDNFFNPKPLKN